MFWASSLEGLQWHLPIAGSCWFQFFFMDLFLIFSFILWQFLKCTQCILVTSNLNTPLLLDCPRNASLSHFMSSFLLLFFFLNNQFSGAHVLMGLGPSTRTWATWQWSHLQWPWAAANSFLAKDGASFQTGTFDGLDLVLVWAPKCEDIAAVNTRMWAHSWCGHLSVNT